MLTFDALKTRRHRARSTRCCLHRRHAGPVDGQAVSRVQHFVDSAYEETHCCNYLLATDLEMATPDGYAATSWSEAAMATTS
jgi:glutamine synthetase